MAADNITLYSDSRFTSPYVMSVYVALVEKDIPFELKTIDLSEEENHRRNYADISITRRVPTLSIDTFNLAESSAITEYLEELYPAPGFTPVYPSDTQDRAIARQVQAWLRSDFLEIREERSTEVIFYADKNPEPLSGAAGKSLNKLLSGLDNLLEDDAQNLFGDWCIADTDVTLMLNRLIMNGDNIPEKFRNYADHQWKRESVCQWVKLSAEKDG